MSITTQDSRILIKCLTTSGLVPTVAPSNDHTDGSWSETSVYVRELLLNSEDGKVWVRTNDGIKEILVLPNTVSDGDLFAVSGSGFVRLSAGTSGYVLTSNGANTLPTYQASGGGGGGSVNSVTGGTNISITGTATDPIINSLSDRYKTSSVTSNSVSNGSKNFTIGLNLSYIPLQEILIVYDGANHMHGEVTSYDDTTGALVVDIKKHTGSGTYTSWIINLDGTASGGGTQTLSSVLDLGNTSGNNDIVFDATYGLQFDNSSRLREGTIDAGLGGSKGVAQICGVGYELKWEGGRQYVMGSSGNTIRQSLYNFSTTPTVNDDTTIGYAIGSLWTLVIGVTYR